MIEINFLQLLKWMVMSYLIGSLLSFEVVDVLQKFIILIVPILLYVGVYSYDCIKDYRSLQLYKSGKLNQDDTDTTSESEDLKL